MCHYFGAVDGAYRGQIGRQQDIVKVLPEKIDQLAAGAAEKMVVPGGYGLEPGLALGSVHPMGQLEFLKSSQGSVYRVEREGGEPFSQPFVKSFGGRVVVRLQQFVVDFQTLVGHFESGTLADLFKVLDLVVEIIYRHKEVNKVGVK